MVSPRFISSACLIFISLISQVSAATTTTSSNISCPTITKTTQKSNCPAPTPATCPTPYCGRFEPIDVPCGCPTIVPSTTVYTACSTACHNNCMVYTETNLLPCPTTATSTSLSSASTPQPTTCLTKTVTEGPECWSAGCPVTYSRCARSSSITLKCGCTTIPTVTACMKTCDGGCYTNWGTAFLPCPTSVNWLTETRSVPVLSVPTFD